jgi:hypothetical protein
MSAAAQQEIRVRSGRHEQKIKPIESISIFSVHFILAAGKSFARDDKGEGGASIGM